MESLVTTPPAAYGQFGTTLAFAEQTLTDRLHEHLAKRDTKPETWYALQLIATRGPGLAREAVTNDLERSRNIKADSTHQLLARLEADGLIRGDAELDLTDKGKALHRSLREYIIGPTTQLLSQFDIHDIETTVRTLQAITKAATEDDVAGGGGS
jgi:DNA-binding MarR family transcriptional regulator